MDSYFVLAFEDGQSISQDKTLMALKIKPNVTGNMKNIYVQDLTNFVGGVLGAYVECNGDDLSAVRMVDTDEAKLLHGQQLALRAPANRSGLRGLDFLVLHAIGRNQWNNGYVNSPDPADHDAEAAYRWGQAMEKMRDFYQQAVKRKGLSFNGQ